MTLLPASATPAAVPARVRLIFRPYTAQIPRAHIIILAMGAFLAPLRWPRLGDSNLSFSDVLLALGALLWFFESKSERSRRVRAKRYFRSLMLGVALVSAGLILSSLIAGATARVTSVTSQYLLSYGVLAIVFFGQSRHGLLLIARAYLFGLLSVCISGLILATFFPEFGVASGLVEENGRLSSFIGNSNGFAKTLALSIPLAVVMVREKALSNVEFCAVCVAFVLGIAASGSFGGLVAGLATFTTLAILIPKTKRSVITLAAVTLTTALGAAVFVGLYGLPEAVEERVLPALSAGDISSVGSFDARTQLAAEAWAVIKEAPVFGIGADQFREESTSGQSAHNILLLLWAEGGVLATLGFLLILMLPFRVGLRARRSHRDRFMAACVIALGVAFLAAVLTGNHAYVRHLTLPFVLVISLAAAPSAEHRLGGTG